MERAFFFPPSLLRLLFLLHSPILANFYALNSEHTQPVTARSAEVEYILASINDPGP